MHHFFVRVNYLVYSRENVSLVDVHSIIYILSKSTASFFWEKNDSCEQNKMLCGLRAAILRSFKEEN